VPKQQLSGASRPLATRWSGALRTSYETPIGNGLVIGIAGNLQFKSKYDLFPFDHPVDTQSSHATVDATLSLRTADYRWAAEIIGRNLTNQYALLRSGDTPATGGGTGTPDGFFADRVGNPIMPRTVAVRLTYQNL
jgi:iron complex outermembrane recepter protein